MTSADASAHCSQQEATRDISCSRHRVGSIQASGGWDSRHQQAVADIRQAGLAWTSVGLDSVSGIDNRATRCHHHQQQTASARHLVSSQQQDISSSAEPAPGHLVISRASTRISRHQQSQHQDDSIHLESREMMRVTVVIGSASGLHHQ